MFWLHLHLTFTVSGIIACASCSALTSSSSSSTKMMQVWPSEAVIGSQALSTGFCDLMLHIPQQMACTGAASRVGSSRHTQGMFVCLSYLHCQVVIKDILLGTPPHCNGLLCEMFGIANSGPWANPAYIICGVALACAPFLLLR